MKTQKILALLIEASTADTARATKIQCELADATAAFNGEHFEIDTPAAGVLVLCDALFLKLYEENPHLLPSMLPVFDLICGDRDSDSIIK